MNIVDNLTFYDCYYTEIDTSIANMLMNFQIRFLLLVMFSNENYRNYTNKQ